MKFFSSGKEKGEKEGGRDGERVVCGFICGAVRLIDCEDFFVGEKKDNVQCGNGSERRSMHVAQVRTFRFDLGDRW